MPYVIAQPCIGVKDTSCLLVCPVDCIHPRPNQAEGNSTDQLFIDASTCIDCGFCASECPVNAIFPEEDLPAEWRHFVEKNASHFRKASDAG